MIAAEEPLTHVAYVYDGTPEGLLTAVFQAYANHEDPEDIARESSFQPRLGQSVRKRRSEKSHTRPSPRLSHSTDR